jgi:hypothetical protein
MSQTTKRDSMMMGVLDQKFLQKYGYLAKGKSGFNHIRATRRRARNSPRTEGAIGRDFFVDKSSPGRP